MASCGYCGSTILFGGTSVPPYTFCNATCQSKGALLIASEKLPAESIAKLLTEVHQGNCPQCGGTGPVDVHTSHTVVSMLVMTQWKSTPTVSCRPCGVKAQLKAALMSLVVGWWGIPWGIVMTPVQIVRNLFALASPPNPLEPSKALEKLVRMNVASKALKAAAPAPAR